MTNPEFKLEFNTYYNNVTSNQAPGYNDFEISQFLTLAEEQIVSELYENRYSGFEKTENLRKSLDSLLRTVTLEPIKDTDNIFDKDAYDVNTFNTSSNPDDIMFIVMEWARIGTDYDSELRTYGKEKTVEVIPIKYDDFLRTYKNPFRGASSKRVLRVDTKDDKVKLYTEKDWTILSYRVEFLKKPNPIIIGNSDYAGFKINGKDGGTDCPCELDSMLHRPILLRAVQLAKAAWQSK